MTDGTTAPRNHGWAPSPVRTARRDSSATTRSATGPVTTAWPYRDRKRPSTTPWELAAPSPSTTTIGRAAWWATSSLSTARSSTVRAASFLRQLGWITCEETVAGPNQGWARTHGYCYLVPTSADGTVQAVPLPAMGRFAHEAVAQDVRTGTIYETEDSGNDSGLHRFRPPIRPTSLPAEAGQPEVAAQVLAGGAALFNRLEGIWWDPHSRPSSSPRRVGAPPATA